MSCLWMSLSLFFVLQHSVLSDEVAKLLCPQTVKVRAGESISINCSIQDTKSRCEGTRFTWKFSDHSGSNQVNLCKNHNNSICQWDKQTYVSLTIQKVTTDKNVTVEINLSCGMDTAEIQVKIRGNIRDIGTLPTTSSCTAFNKTDPSAIRSGAEINVAFIMFGILAVTAGGISYFLYKAKRNRNSQLRVNQEEIYPPVKDSE